VERRQVIEVPPVEPVVTDHQAVELECSCGARTKAEFPAGVRAPVQYGPRVMAIGVYLWHGQFLSRDRGLPGPGRAAGLRPVSRRAGLGGPDGRPPGRPGRPGHRGRPGAGRGRALRRDRLPGRREADVGALRVVREVGAGHCPSEAREGRDGGRGGPPCLHRDRSPRRVEALRLFHRRGRARLVRRICCASSRPSPRPARTWTGRGRSRPSTPSWR
jgi:hypothetical protein